MSSHFAEPLERKEMKINAVVIIETIDPAAGTTRLILSNGYY